MEHFLIGFQEELAKTAGRISPATKSWAFSRGATSGAAAALMGLAMLEASGKQKGRSKKERREAAIRSAVIPGLVGTGVGLGKGFAEKGLERKILKMITKGK